MPRSLLAGVTAIAATVLLAPGFSPAAHACSLPIDASELVPANGATRVPVLPIITVPESVSVPSLERVSDGAAVDLERAPVEGTLLVKAYRPAVDLDADAEYRLGDGRVFRTAAAGDAPSVTTWEIESSGAEDLGGGSGCGTSSSCDGVYVFRVMLKPLVPGDQAGYFNIYADLSGQPSIAAVAFARAVDAGDGRLSITISGNENVKPGSSIRIAPVDLAGNESTALGPVPYDEVGDGGGCRAAGGGRPQNLAAALAVLALAAGGVVRRRRLR